MEDDRLLDVHGMITDCWKVYKDSYKDMKDEDNWWNHMIAAMDDVTKKYKDDPLVIAIACACLNDLERICRS